VELMDKCDLRDVQLSESAMQNINDLFLKGGHSHCHCTLNPVYLPPLPLLPLQCVGWP
jgi:hypothetical protein